MLKLKDILGIRVSDVFVRCSYACRSASVCDLSSVPRLSSKRGGFRLHQEVKRKINPWKHGRISGEH